MGSQPGHHTHEVTPDLKESCRRRIFAQPPRCTCTGRGNLDLAEADKERLEELQRERRRQGRDREPQWFRNEGDEWVYAEDTGSNGPRAGNPRNRLW